MGSIFFEGGLQAGISHAIQKSKAVVCFLTDDEELSVAWETNLKRAPEIPYLIQAECVLLRIQLGSAEHSFLSAFCPVQRAPVLVVIDEGRLKACITQVYSPETVAKALEIYLTTGQPPNPATLSAGQAATSPSHASAPVSSVPDTAAITQASTEERIPSVSGQVQEEHTTAEPEPEESPTRYSAVEKGKDKAKSDVETNRSSLKEARRGGPDSSWIEEQKKRQEQAKEDRKRILAQIEADKAARRAEAELKKAQRREQSGGTQAASPLIREVSAAKKPTTSGPRPCSIQVRLLDGSSLRLRVSSTDNITSAIRPKVDAHYAENKTRIPPYTFKHFNPPSPARPIEAGEEMEDLQSLGLCPSATLVLAPIHTYTEAYSGDGGLVSTASGWLGWGVQTGVGIVGSAAGMVGTFLGLGGTPQQPAQPAPPAGHTLGGEVGQGKSQHEDGSAAGSANIKVRTLADQRREEDERGKNKFYNGNALNFEPRSDDTPK